jgi:hypothetical protein
LTYYTATDVPLRSVSICIVDDEGTIHFEGKAASEVDKVVTCLKQFSPDIHSVGFEAGALTR